MGRWKKVLCVLLFLALVLGGGHQYGGAVYAGELTNDSIKKKEAEISKTQQEKKNLQSGLTDIKALKKELEASKADLASYVTQLDAKLTAIQKKIEELKTLISDKEQEIVEKTAELEEAVRVQQAQYDAMRTRIKFLYEKGEMLYIELIFSAESFGDVLNKADYIEMLSAYDRRMLDEYVAYTEYVGLCREGLEEERDVLNEAKAAVEQEEASLNEMLKEKQQEMNKLSADIQGQEAAIREYEADIAARYEIIAALEAAVAEEKK